MMKVKGIENKAVKGPAETKGGAKPPAPAAKPTAKAGGKRKG